MKKILMMFFIFLISTSYLYSQENISAHQWKIKNIAKIIGEDTCIKSKTNKMCFGKTLQAIVWQESSYGLNIIGDRNKKVFYYKFNNTDFIVSKKETFLKNNIRYVYFNLFNKRYIRKVFIKTIRLPLSEASLGPFQIRLETAKMVILNFKLKKHYFLLKDDDKLISSLLSDPWFSGEIASLYLKMNYIHGLKNNHWDPWVLAVSRYNGGNYNEKYLKKIISKIKKL
jgi:hypothetical protein